jgi:ATP-dependent helicase/DNAse subunit B
MLRSLNNVKHPSEAADPNGEAFLLAPKPRGVLDGGHFEHFDAAAEPSKWSDVLQVYVTKDGGLGNLKNSDVAPQAEFAALLAHVGRKMGELADDIARGEIRIRPYRYNKESPCPRCAYRAVCRFDPPTSGYRTLAPMGRDEVLQQVMQSEGTADSP